MTPEPAPSSTRAAERRPAIWPWLLLPLATLALFFALRALEQPPMAEALDAAPLAVEAPDDSEAAGSR